MEILWQLCLLGSQKPDSLSHLNFSIVLESSSWLSFIYLLGSSVLFQLTSKSLLSTKISCILCFSQMWHLCLYLLPFMCLTFWDVFHYLNLPSFCLMLCVFTFCYFSTTSLVYSWSIIFYVSHFESEQPAPASISRNLVFRENLLLPLNLNQVCCLFLF